MSENNENNILDTEAYMTESPAEENSGNEPEKSINKKAVVNEIIDWVKTIFIGVLAGVLVVVFVIQRDNVFGDSMSPTLSSGDVIFTQKISNYFKHYDRGDIVILDGTDMAGYSRDEYLIKRIVGMPGETIRIQDGKVLVKPKDSEEFFELQENYLPAGVSTLMTSYGLEQGYNECVLGDDEYFCLGDNRPVSNDSRNLGPFTADRIKGVAVIRVYPFNTIKLL